MHFLSASPSLMIGTHGLWPWRLPVILTGTDLTKHKHIMGTTGVGKSKFNAHIAVNLILKGTPCSVIDPHADLAHDVLGLLHAQGFFQTSDAAKKLWYVEFARPDKVIPFNVLNQPYPHQTTARNLLEALKRVFPALDNGQAPNFENILQYTAITLIQNNLPITNAARLLTDKTLRDHLLKQVTHTETIAFFRDRFDQWDHRERTHNIESTLNKLSILTFTDNLHYALGHQDNALNFRRLLDQGISVLFNLSNLDEETRHMIGSLIMVGFEQATLSRVDLPESKRSRYHLLVDEFPQFAARSEEAFTTFLSEARKFNVTLWLSHQTGMQISERFHSALQNTLPIFFQVGRMDALWAAQIFNRYDPYRIKHTVTDETAEQRTHPLFWGLPEQIEETAKTFEELKPQEAYIKLTSPWLWQKGRRQLKFRTVTLKTNHTHAHIQSIREYYARILLTPMNPETAPLPLTVTPPKRTRIDV